MKIHYQTTTGYQYISSCYKGALCGLDYAIWQRTKQTQDKNKVTCKRCIKMLMKQKDQNTKNIKIQLG